MSRLRLAAIVMRPMPSTGLTRIVLCMIFNVSCAFALDPLPLRVQLDVSLRKQGLHLNPCKVINNFNFRESANLVDMISVPPPHPVRHLLFFFNSIITRHRERFRSSHRRSGQIQINGNMLLSSYTSGPRREMKDGVFTCH